jgi:hypothetical protein
VTQLRAKVEETTDAVVAEGQKSVQAAADAGARYVEEAKHLASSAFSTAAVCLLSARGSEVLLILVIQSYLPASLTGGTTGGNAPSGNVPPSTAPLESGPHTVDKPYPTSEVHAQQVAVNESK